MSSATLIAQSNPAELEKLGKPAATSEKEQSEQASAGGAFFDMFMSSLVKSFTSGGFAAGNSKMGIDSIQAAETIATEDRSFLKQDQFQEKAEMFDKSANSLPKKDDGLSVGKEERITASDKVERNSTSDRRAEEFHNQKSRNDESAETNKIRQVVNNSSKAAITQTQSQSDQSVSKAEPNTLGNSKELNDFAKTAAKMAKTDGHGVNKAEVQIDLASKANPVDEKLTNIKSVSKSQAVKAVTSAAVTATAESQGTASQNSGSGESSANLNNSSQNMLASQITAAAASGSKGFASAITSAQGTSGTQTATGVSGTNANISLTSMTNNYTKASVHGSKGADAKAPVYATPTKVIDQVVKFAKLSMLNGKEEIKMILKPDQLGWMKVRLAVNGDKITAHITAENEHVKTMLESNISQLQQSLQNQNLKINQVVINVSDLHDHSLAKNNDEKAHSQSNGESQQQKEEADAQAMLQDEDGVEISTLALTQLTAVDIEI